MDGEDIRRLRLSLKLSQEEFGKQIGVSRVTVGLLERDKKPISLRIEKALALASPKPLAKLPSRYEPIHRQFEMALIDAGIDYECDVEFSGRFVDYCVRSMGVIIFVGRREEFDNSFVIPGWDTIVINGGSAVAWFSKLLNRKSADFPTPPNMR